MTDNNSIKTEAKKLINQYGQSAIEIVKKRIDKLRNSHNRQKDSLFLLLTEIEKLL